MAIEAFTRYKAIHPHKDASGRISELIAQHLLLHGGLSPLLFPNRFDINYILTLSRNGGFVDNRREFVFELVRNTAAFADGIRRASNGSAVTNARSNSDSGHLELEQADGSVLRVKVFYVSDGPSHLSGKCAILSSCLTFLRHCPLFWFGGRNMGPIMSSSREDCAVGLWFRACDFPPPG